MNKPAEEPDNTMTAVSDPPVVEEKVRNRNSAKQRTILYLVDTHVPPLDRPSEGGAEKQLHLLATNLDKTYFRTIIVQLINSASSRVTVGRFENTELMHYPTRRFYSPQGLKQVLRISRLAREKEVDIIHTYFEKSEVMGWMVARLSGIPIWVTSRRDLGFKRKKFYKMMFSITSRNCKKCVAVCKAVAEQAVKQERLLPSKVEVIYNGLERPSLTFSDEGDSVRRELDIAPGAPLVGMIADINFEIKGHRYFIEAARNILQAMPQTEFLLAGDGQLQPRFEALASELGVGRKVHFLGKRTDIDAVLASLNVSVLCSTSEGLSNVILESMGAGKPVVATDVGGNPELVTNGVTGYLVPPADSEALARAILSLIRNPQKARQMGERGREAVTNRFTVDSMVKNYEQLYHALLGNGEYPAGDCSPSPRAKS